MKKKERTKTSSSSILVSVLFFFFAERKNNKGIIRYNNLEKLIRKSADDSSKGLKNSTFFYIQKDKSH